MRAADLDFVPTETGCVCDTPLWNIDIKRGEQPQSFTVQVHIKGSEVHSFDYASVKDAALAVLIERLGESVAAMVERVRMERSWLPAERVTALEERGRDWVAEIARLLG